MERARDRGARDVLLISTLLELPEGSLLACLTAILARLFNRYSACAWYGVRDSPIKPTHRHREKDSPSCAREVFAIVRVRGRGRGRGRVRGRGGGRGRVSTKRGLRSPSLSSCLRVTCRRYSTLLVLV